MIGRECDRVLDLADLYLAGELGARDGDLIEAHLGVCDACRVRVELDRRIRGAVRRHGALVAPSPLLAQRIEAALATPTDHRAVRRWVSVATAAALVLVAVVGAWRWGTHSGWSHARDMAHKHVYYLDQQRAGWVVSSPDREVLERWGSTELGFATALPPETRDMVVLGVRAESVDGTPALLAFFRDRSGQPASLFVMAASETNDVELYRHLEVRGPDRAAGVIREPSSRGDLDVWVEVWREGDLRYALVRVTLDLVDAR